MNLAILHQNVQAVRKADRASWPARAKRFAAVIRAELPDIISLNECDRASAKVLMGHLAPHYRFASYHGVTVIWDLDYVHPVRWLLNRRWWTGVHTHAALIGEFRTSTRRFNFGSSHLPTNPLAPAAQALRRRRSMTALTSAVKGWKDPTLIGTDANWAKTFEDWVGDRGWTSARERAVTRINPTFRTSGGKFTVGNPIDYVIGRRVLVYSRYEVFDGRTYSDHNGLLVEVVL